MRKYYIFYAGVEVKFKGMRYPVLIHTSSIDELHQIVVDKDGVHVGGAVPLSTVEETLKHIINLELPEKTKFYQAVVEMLRWFAGTQIRNTAVSSINKFISISVCIYN